MDIHGLTQLEQEKLKKSYFNMLALFLSEPNVASRFARCFVKWSAQMQISADDVVKLGKDLVELKYSAPISEADKLEAVFHLVYMIYLDRVIEDEELEVAMAYAEKIGLKKTVVVNLFQSIATAASDGISPEALEREVLTFMKANRDA
jgi:hypothetical protein